MKKYFTKPVIAVLAVATIAGGLTPVWASSSTSSDTTNKVVMSNTDQESTRYRLKDLVENDPSTLNLLLKTQADYLYLVVAELKLNEKLSTYMEEHPEEWEKIYKEYYEDIYLEVRIDEEVGFITLNQEVKNDMVYITGKVANDVTKVVLTTPNNGKIEVFDFVDNKFTVTIPAVISSTPQYVELKAYDNYKLLETEKLRVNTGTVEEDDVIVHATATYRTNSKDLKVLGIVDSKTDQVYVTYNGVRKEASLDKVWDGTEAFSVTFDVENPTSKEVLIEAYENRVKIDSEKEEVANIDVPDVVTPTTFAIKGTASISPKYKTVTVKGTIEASGTVDTSKYKLYAIAPDGGKHLIQWSGKNQFEANLPFKNRSYSSKGVTILLVDGEKVVAQTLIAHGTPVNVLPAPIKPQPQVPVKKVKVEVKKPKHGEWEVEHDDDDDQGKGKGKGKDKKKH